MTSDCEKIQQLLQSYLEGQLIALTRQTVDKHLVRCSECSEDIADLKLANAAIKEWQKTTQDITPSSDLKAKILIKRRQIPISGNLETGSSHVTEPHQKNATPSPARSMKPERYSESTGDEKPGWHLSLTGQRFIRWGGVAAALAAGLVLALTMPGTDIFKRTEKPRDRSASRVSRPAVYSSDVKEMVNHVTAARNTAQLSELGTVFQAAAARHYTQPEKDIAMLISMEQLSVMHMFPCGMEEKRLIINAVLQHTGENKLFAKNRSSRIGISWIAARNGLDTMSLFSKACADTVQPTLIEELTSLEFHGQYLQALKLCREHLRQAQKSPITDVRMREAMILMKLGDLSAAKTGFEQVVRGSTDKAQITVARHLGAECALKLSERAKPSSSHKTPEAKLEAARICVKRYQHREAETMLTGLLDAGLPSSHLTAEAQLQLAFALRQQGAFERALAALGNVQQSSAQLEALARALESSLYYRLDNHLASRNAALATAELLYQPDQQDWKHLMLFFAALVEHHHLNDDALANGHLDEVKRFSSGPLSEAAASLISRWQQDS